mmetsp:Transcript_115361/g.333252  ORF Transcript_115361/g.333252 Transcript_115361/m.333252 type:complete len:136 (-) Transcript_115361:427-834(-)
MLERHRMRLEMILLPKRKNLVTIIVNESINKLPKNRQPYGNVRKRRYNKQTTRTFTITMVPMIRFIRKKTRNNKSNKKNPKRVGILEIYCKSPKSDNANEKSFTNAKLLRNKLWKINPRTMWEKKSSLPKPIAAN